MSALELLILAALGMLAGIVNTLAGGGSMLIVPTMVFMGIPATAANATLRPAILTQAFFGLVVFARRGIVTRPFLRSIAPLVLATLPGAVIAAYFATRVSDRLFEIILAVVLVGLAILSWRKKAPARAAEPKSGLVLTLIFLAIGLYGGFIQIGVGFLLATAILLGRPSAMAQVHAAKVFVVFCYTLIALPVFITAGDLHWGAAIALAAGQSCGGVLGARLVSRADDRLLRRIYVAAMIAFAIALLIRASG